MPKARIYLPAKTAMQSGHRNTREWVLEFEPQARKSHDPLMGWTASADTLGQVRLTFETKEDAITYAREAWDRLPGAGAASAAMAAQELCRQLPLGPGDLTAVP